MRSGLARLGLSHPCLRDFACAPNHRTLFERISGRADAMTVNRAGVFGRSAHRSE